MKKVIIGFICCLGILFGFIFYKNANPDPITVDLTENITIKFSGEDTLGTAKIKGTFEDTTGKSYMSKFAGTVSYSISKEDFLSNGDKVTIKAKYDKSLAKKKNIIVTGAKKTFKVKGLKERYETYKGITVKKGLSNKEKEEAYQEYQEAQSYTLDDTKVSAPENAEIYQGDLNITTDKSSKTFDSFSDAYNYGKESSQKFKINTSEKNGQIKYECEFVDETDGSNTFSVTLLDEDDNVKTEDDTSTSQLNED